MSQYRKKPVVIDAVQWLGAEQTDLVALEALGLKYNAGGVVRLDGGIEIRTLEGVMLASVGDFIVRGVKGELYPCKPDIFAETNEPVDASPSETTGGEVGKRDPKWNVDAELAKSKDEAVRIEGTRMALLAFARSLGVPDCEDTQDAALVWARGIERAWYRTSAPPAGDGVPRVSEKTLQRLRADVQYNEAINKCSDRDTSPHAKYMAEVLAAVEYAAALSYCATRQGEGR